MVWGRGALDMKSEVAANAVAIASLAREGFRPSGDLIFAATADEEVGDGFGLEWLCEAHPDAVRCDFAINEGGGDRIELEDGRPIYAATVAEKMTAPFRLRVRGRSGHASMPRHRRQRARQCRAADRADRRVPAGAAARPRGRGLPASRARRGARPRAEAVAARARPLSPVAAVIVDALLAPTFSPTIISASQKRNVIPALCEIEVDCRLLPGQHPEHVEPMIRAVLGGDVDYELEWIEARGGTRSLARHAALARARGVGRRGRAGSERRAARVRRLHRQPLAARGVRHRRLRLLPLDGRAAAGGRRVAHPLRRRAHPGRRPRARGQLAAPRRAGDARLSATTLRRDGEGEDPARRHGPPERRARARAARVGVRDPARRRADRGRLGAQAPPGVADREPAPARPRPARRGAAAAAADQGEASGGAAADGEPAHARLDARRRGRSSAVCASRGCGRSRGSCCRRSSRSRPR